MELLTPLIITTAIISTSAMAQDHTLVITPTIETINTLELNHVFDTTQLDQIQVLELSKQEMKETEGAWLPVIYAMATGAAFGVGINTTFTYATTQQLPTWQSQAFAAGSGAVGGAYANVMLRGAGIATSPFVSSAWQGTTGIANATIRANGAMLGQGYVGVNKVNIPANASRPPVPSFNYQNSYSNNMNKWNSAVPIGYGYR